MKIVRLIYKFDKNISGGIIPNTYYISQHQVKQGHQVWIFAFTKEKPKKEIIDGIKVIWIKKPKFIRWLGGVAFFKAIKKQKINPDIIHGLNAIPFGWLFPFWKNKIKAKYILSVHGSIKALEQGYVKGWKNILDSFEFSKLITFLAKKVDLILPVAEFIKKELITADIPSKKIQVIPTGLDFSLFYNPVWQEKLKQDLSKKEKITILNVGRFAQLKGLTYLIKAINLLKKEVNCELILIGGKKDDNDYKNIIDLISKLNLQKIVHIKSPLPYKELPKIYHQADIFVLSSIYEPKGKVIQEAQAAGLPVIATNAGGTTELIKHKENGILISPKNENEIKRAILEIISNQNLKEKIAKNGIATTKNLDWKIIAEKYSQEFSKIL